MKRLVLMRHAKSAWADPHTDDHDRPLNPRGLQSAKALGNWLRANGITPDQAFVSTALRTRQTFDGLGLGLEAHDISALYLGEPRDILATLRAATGQSILIVGHNPGIGTLARQILRRPPAHPRFVDYPTGATLVAGFDLADWNKVHPGTGQVQAFTIPRDLDG